MGIRAIVPRPKAIRQDGEKVNIFKGWLKVLVRGDISVWCFDETGFHINSKPRRVLAPKGSKPLYPYTGEHIKENIMGAVNIITGQLEALFMPHSNTKTFQIFLDYLNQVIGDKLSIVIMDNAAWHKSGELIWGNILSVYLPPYSPELNPIEELWKVLKDRMPPLKIIKNNDELQEIILENLRPLLDAPEEVLSICNISNILK